MSLNTVSTKPHFLILDGLRGIAALMVVIFHFLEAHSTSHYDMMLNHTYLAVDFFFLLSGFVIGYAYDDRWMKISIGDFFKRRIIRLQPMLIAGTILGALLFYTQAGEYFYKIEGTSIGMLLFVTLLGCTLLPLPTSMDVRGWDEMHPLNGPAWSLYFEYIANILYAVIVRRFSTWLLSVFVVLCGAYLLHLLFLKGMIFDHTSGDVIGGWALTKQEMYVGFARLLYPFFAGLLLYRVAKLTKVSNGFIWAGLLLIFVLSFPRVGGPETNWMNGIYEAVVILLVFPSIVYIGASGTISNPFIEKVCKFLGELSYPIYISHHVFIYCYYAIIKNNKLTLAQSWPYAVGGTILAIAVAYALLKWYDEPVREWLKKKWKA